MIARRTLLGGVLAAGGLSLVPRRALAGPTLSAATYTAERGGISFLVMRAGEVVFENYPNGGAPDRPHELASGAKSFTGVMAAAAVQDQLMVLDEPAADTLPEWRNDPVKRLITIRQILSLTSGLDTRQTRGNLLTYAEGIGMPVVATPGERFAYGGDPFQLFGAVLHRKLRERETPAEYLKRRVLDPAGVFVGSWRNGPDGLPRLGSGARLTAREWAKYGDLVRRDCMVDQRALVDSRALAAHFQGSAPNPAYGLGWWLNRPMPDDKRAAIPQLANATDVHPDDRNLPSDLFFAAGAGQQRLYVSKTERLVVVRQADNIRAALRRRGIWKAERGPRWSDRAFWAALRKDAALG
ncbi:MAG TPA: serine hydrolase [Sphingomonadaceae bacterium]|nr:serine hydrolase [Sphingomonadaceae bacterium]